MLSLLEYMDIHEKLIETITTSIFYLELIENYENDMAAHGICFDFQPSRRPSTITALPAKAFADARLAATSLPLRINVDYGWSSKSLF